MHKQANELVLKIYRLAYKTSISDFKKQCFELLADALDIQSGTWITRSEKDILFYENDSFTYALPEGFMEDYHHLSSVSEQVNQVFSVLLGNQRKTLDILDVVPSEDWFDSEMYRLYCDKFNLHHSLMTVDINPINQVMNLITVARHNPAHGFTEEEKSLKEFIFPNLIEALRINLLNALHSGVDFAGSYRAVMDRYGNVIEAEDGFLALLSSKQLTLGTKVLIDFEAHHHHTLEIKGLSFRYKNHNGLVFVEVDLASLIEVFSERKVEIAQLLLNGLSNKEIGNKLGLSPNTVHNHLKEIYKTIGVASRTQAIGCLCRFDLTGRLTQNFEHSRLS